MHDQPEQWKKTTYSSPSQCIEVSNRGGVRDSKDPNGLILRVDLHAFLLAVKAGRLSR